MLPRLYELRSLVRAAFTSMGSVLRAKIVVEIAPATTGRFMPATLGAQADRPRREKRPS
jgi:hypothetical protein